MNFVVFGGSGFVGTNIAERLLADGHNVVLFDRSPLPQAAARALAVYGDRLATIVGDVTDRVAVRSVVTHGVDIVVLGAAITAGPEREKRDAETILQVNLVSHAAILEAAREASVRRVINLSSAAAYGAAGERGVELTEDTPCEPKGLYAITKWSSERVGERLASLWGLDYVSLRLSGVFGPWEYATGVRDTLSAQAQILAAAEAGTPATLARAGLRDWIYAPDVADAVVIVSAAKALRHSVYNVSTGAPFAVLEWGEKLAELVPGLECRLAHPGEAPTIDLHSAVDRAPLSVARLADEFGWRARTRGTESATQLWKWWQKTKQ
ncbi:dTDP-glucose 4,6-dehydratase [Variibacter gotjawalensis]|uniref:dTDP-glucose 4,6-dehydratase n=1 Tax=Variibacter gotjawalensis TaxID=1333996 RepID=A0A0S3PZV2_9BRAD|nr:NAD(P)-dependent oxidoreductase [Variibacter gotjawalensis]NIK47287.1 UDP-glucose 4-epimerase [Variibacter gotjawalensis]RZS49186.1 UDP-glucose 4-epimerase [Variibacter gotjawalensis]BAT61448.1 dTDP-glucose 4,6-dehydratase [Variibacter gotjawalensis]